MKPVFMRYTKNDIINFIVLLVLGFLVIPNVIKSDYWYTSILIPWLCLTIAALGQNIVMGYTAQLSLGAAGKRAPSLMSATRFRLLENA